MNLKKSLNIISTISKNKIINGSRYILVNYFPNFLNSYLLVEYPKSGATWLGQLISSYLNIPFPRNRLPMIKKSLIHGHYFPNKKFKHFNKIFFMIRDGRNVIVSYYYFFFFMASETPNHKDYLYIKKQLVFKNYDDVKSNLPSFIEFMFTYTPPKYIRISYEGNWSDFNRKWSNYCRENIDKVIMVKYEDLLKDTEKELIRILNRLNTFGIDEERVKEIVKKYSFQRQSGRKQGNENPKSFLRKGISGDWKNKFTKKAAEVFYHYAGDLLIDLGYENDKEWVKRFSKSVF
jgi:hypothetical protein